MKIAVAVIGLMFLASSACADENAELKTEKDRLSYSLGMDIGRTLKSQAIDFDPETLARGIRDAHSGENLQLTEEEFRATMARFQEDMKAKQQAHVKEVSEKNLREGQEFLAENGKKEGVVSLPSGLQYKVITQGDGPMPKDTDTVTVHYRGTLIDGTEFDSSYSRAEPATFPVKGVIPGWTEALQLMKTGSKWRSMTAPI